MNTTAKAAGIAAAALAGYDVLVRPRILNWGASRDEQRMQLPGDDIASGVPAQHTKAVTIQAPPEAVWPWLAQLPAARNIARPGQTARRPSPDSRSATPAGGVPPAPRLQQPPTALTADHDGPCRLPRHEVNRWWPLAREDNAGPTKRPSTPPAASQAPG